MNNKEIQEQRMRSYFIQATKEILKAEGLRSISVRNIANKAGYSYATLYNYFKDIKDLIFLCVKDFQAECEDFSKENIKGVEPGKERIKAILISYVNYFNQYPGIFELFYIETMSDISSNREATNLIISFTDRLCKDDWEFCIAKKQFSDEEVKLKKESLNLMISGLLLLYLNRRSPGSYKEFTDSVSRQIDFLLE